MEITMLSKLAESGVLGIMLVMSLIAIGVLWRYLGQMIQRLFLVVENNTRALADLRETIRGIQCERCAESREAANVPVSHHPHSERKLP